MGSGARYIAMEEWLGGENYGIDGRSITSVGARGGLNDAVAVHVSSPVSAAAFVARWCIPGDPLLRSAYQEPPRHVPMPAHG